MIWLPTTVKIAGLNSIGGGEAGTGEVFKVRLVRLFLIAVLFKIMMRRTIAPAIAWSLFMRRTIVGRAVTRRAVTWRIGG